MAHRSKATVVILYPYGNDNIKTENGMTLEQGIGTNLAPMLL
jgi:hypothetical protein